MMILSISSLIYAETEVNNPTPQIELFEIVKVEIEIVEPIEEPKEQLSVF